MRIVVKYYSDLEKRILLLILKLRSCVSLLSHLVDSLCHCLSAVLKDSKKWNFPQMGWNDNILVSLMSVRFWQAGIIHLKLMFPFLQLLCGIICVI